MGEQANGLGATTDEVIESLREDLEDAYACIRERNSEARERGVHVQTLEEALRGCKDWIEAITDGVEANYPEVWWEADRALGKGESDA